MTPVAGCRYAAIRETEPTFHRHTLRRTVFAGEKKRGGGREVRFFLLTLQKVFFRKLTMKNLAIFASGSGTNAENIANLFHQGNRVRVAVVLCNRRQAGVYERMERLGVPVKYIPSSVWDSDPDQVLEALRPYHIDLVVLAGFMRKVHPAIVKAYEERMVNIHPSLLPAYGGKGMYGHHVHEAVIAAGEKKSGVTVHYVTDKMDEGAIVMQQSVDIAPGETPESLEAKIHEVEYSLYPRAIVVALNRAGDRYKDKSVDTAWAEVLKLNYDEQEAERRREQAQKPQPQAAAPLPPVPQSAPAPQQPSQSSHYSRPSQNAPQMAPQPQPADRPKSHLVMAILMTLFCCMVPGIVAIVYGASVSSRMSAGDLEGARRASRRAEGWIIASFVLGLLSATLWFPLSIISSAF